MMKACWAQHRAMLERAKVAGVAVILDVGPRSLQTKYLRALWYAAGQPCSFFAFDPWGDHRPTTDICDAVFAQTLIDQEWRRRLFGSLPESLEGA